MKCSFIGLACRVGVVVIAVASVGCATRRSSDGDQGGHSGTTGSGGTSTGSGGAGTGTGGGGTGSGGASTGSGGAAGGPPTSSGVEPTKTVGGLAVPDRKTLCDWDASLYGGYGKTTTCPGGLSTTNDASQDACVNNWPTDCTTPVGDYEACARNLAADPCDVSTLFSAECQKVSDSCF